MQSEQRQRIPHDGKRRFASGSAANFASVRCFAFHDVFALFSFGVRALVFGAAYGLPQKPSEARLLWVKSGATCIKDKRTHHRHNPNFVILLTVEKMDGRKPSEGGNTEN